MSIRYIFPLPNRDPITGPIYYGKIINAPKDSVKHLRLGSLQPGQPNTEFTPHSIWGEELGGKDLLSGQKHMMGGRQLIEIQLGSQKYQAYVHILHSPSNGRENEFVHLLREEEFPFVD